MIDYNRLVPSDTFMGRYLSYMQSQETAASFDWWGGMWALAAACARFAYVNRPRAPVYLNMFVIFVGESGVVRKTTAVHAAANVTRSMLRQYADIALMDAKLTPEKLDEILHERTQEHGTAQLCIAVPELAVFMGTEQYIAHMPTLLTDLYDCPAARFGGGTLARGEIMQQNVWLHFLSASTPVWLLKTVNPNVVEGGFTSRCYFIIANEPKHRIAWPTEPDALMYNDLCEDLRIIATEARTRPPVELHDDALQLFTQWYANRRPDLDAFKNSFSAREDAHVLRVAALLCINDGSWLVHTYHIERAIALIADVKQHSSKIFEFSDAQRKYGGVLDMIRMQLINAGMDPVPHGRLYLKCRTRMDSREFVALLDVLEELGAIQRFDFQNDRGRPMTLIRGTQKLIARGLGESVMARFT